MSNSIVIGNPPYGGENNSTGLHKKFIEFSIQHSDYVVFVLPVDMYKKDNLKNAKLFKSYKLPKVKYSGVELLTCINFYKKRVEPLRLKKIKNVEIINFARNSDTTKQDELNWKLKKSDYRIATFGTVRVLKSDDSVKCSETKLTFKKKVNFNPILEKFLKGVHDNSISSSGVSNQMLIDLIWDTYPELRDYENC
ncbi:hypothetical protein [Pseudostreptobacillus hongkongensis]|uniref:hypothetical protein n=1 Tax=Pseudostreptobacillus hongkongensis TaxID=1162717 RepID=UPI0008335673|nr:hypothetical protein [Pseudostreptobacillus hongkongensis]